MSVSILVVGVWLYFELGLSLNTLIDMNETSEDLDKVDLLAEIERNQSLPIAQELDKFKSKLSTQGDYVFGVFLIVTGVLSALGNGSILAVFYYRRGSLSPVEVFLVNLGIVDIIFSALSFPCALISSFEHKWIFGETGCTIHGFITYFFGVATVMSLTAIAIVRYLKTCSLSLGNRINCQTSVWIIFWVYIYSFFWACLPLTGFASYDFEPFGLSCNLEWAGKGILSQLHIILVCIFCVFMPIIVIVFCYIQIILLVRKSDKLMRDQRCPRSPRIGKLCCHVNDAQLSLMSLVITLGFVIGWMPYCVVSLWGGYTGEIMLPIWATPFPVLMAKSSITYNPLIYLFLTKRYRDDLGKLINLLCLCKRRGRNPGTGTGTNFKTGGTSSPKSQNILAFNPRYETNNASSSKEEINLDNLKVVLTLMK